MTARKTKPKYLTALLCVSALLATSLTNGMLGKVHGETPESALQAKDKLTIVSAKELHDRYLANTDYVLIDNRPDYKFRTGHLPGAFNLPYFKEGATDNLLNREMLLKVAGQKKIIFYCTGYDRAYHASIDSISKWSVPEEKVIWFKGGMTEWLDEGYPVAK